MPNYQEVISLLIVKTYWYVYSCITIEAGAFLFCNHYGYYILPLFNYCFAGVPLMVTWVLIRLTGIRKWLLLLMSFPLDCMKNTFFVSGTIFILSENYHCLECDTQLY